MVKEHMNLPLTGRDSSCYKAHSPPLVNAEVVGPGALKHQEDRCLSAQEKNVLQQVL